MTWTWTCLICRDDDSASGTADEYEDAVAAAHAHNSECEHVPPAMSYHNNDA